MSRPTPTNRQRVTSRSCEFCDEFAGGSANSFFSRYANEIASRTILEQDGFRVLPSLGQIVPGYLLLVPNHHYHAFADMSLQELKTAEALKTSLAERMRTVYGDILFFEHGVRAPESGGCGISHAHFHLVPFSGVMEPLEVLAGAYPFEEVSSLPDLKQVGPDRSYLYYESARGNRYVFYPQFVPSQYIRRLLADALGIGVWDWRQCGREERLLGTLSLASKHLAGVPS